ncbi:hypothetical protein JOC55_005539 [Paenibacillus sacheonensis]|nr:hypothetical protein [Paenibacillus sacheonensis]
MKLLGGSTELRQLGLHKKRNPTSVTWVSLFRSTAALAAAALATAASATAASMLRGLGARIYFT